MRRTLTALPFLVAMGCGSDKDAPDLGTYDGAADALVEVREDLAGILEGIEDKESAEAARPAVMSNAKRASEVLAAIKKLGEPAEEEEKKFYARIDAAMEKLDARMEKTTDRLRRDPGTWAVVEAMLDEHLAAADPGEARRQVFAVRLRKQSNLKALLGLLLTADGTLNTKLPMKDGVLDVYALVRSGRIGRGEYSLLRAREDGLPTDEEIERGDYSNFPYDRYRGTGDLDPAASVPLLWDKAPDAEGVFVVGMSAGFARGMDKEELAEALGR